jgi:predicted peptidase
MEHLTFNTLTLHLNMDNVLLRNLFLLISWLCCFNLFGQEETTIPYSNDSAYVTQRIAMLRNVDATSFKPFTYKGADGIDIRYRLYAPQGPGAVSKRLPLVLVFHGSGQIGTDNNAQLGILPKLFAHEETQGKYPSYILAPQFPTRSSNYSLDSTRNVLKSTPRSCLQTVLELVDSLIHVLPIDSTRIYVAGYSMGASTTINALSARPDLFAAGISIAGIPQFNQGEQIRHIPLWLIHGTADDVNTIQSDEYFFREFNRSNLRFWKLKGINHDILTTSTLLDSSLSDWLFNQRKS